jgi:hypothetical protein
MLPLEFFVAELQSFSRFSSGRVSVGSVPTDADSRVTQWRTLPATIPQWLVRRPTLLVACLGWINTLRRSRFLLPLSAVLLGAAIWVMSRPAFAGVVEVCARYPLVIVALSALHSATSAVRRKPRFDADRSRSWLTPLPHGLSARAQLVLAPVVQLIVIALILLICWAVSAVRTTSVETVLLAAVAGYAIGGLAGWAILRASQPKNDDWRYAFVRRVRAQWATKPKLQPLSYWAVAQGRVFFNPRTVAPALVPALCAIPMGKIGLAFLAFVGTWLLGLYLLSLLAAIVRAAFPAAWWLAPTSITFSRFTLYLIYRAVAMQAIVWCVVLFFIAALERPQLLRSLYVNSGVWMVIVIAVATASCALAMSSSSLAGSRPHRWLG